MAGLPETRYAKSGEVHIAYNVLGDGPVDLVQVPAFTSNIEVFFEEPRGARWMRRLASFSRLISFDKRGTGLSDRVCGTPTLEERMDDIRAVMAAVGSERAALIGYWEGGPLSALFAATHPDQVSALILYGTLARFTWAPDYPWAPTAEAHESLANYIVETWGQGMPARVLAPSLADDEAFRRFWGKLERHSSGPGQAGELWRMNMGLDVRPILSTIRVPTLVLHRSRDQAIPVQSGRYVASQIPGARFVELPGEDHLNYVGDLDAVADEIQEFLTGARAEPEADRVLATVLFTDIVESTRRASELGDHRWRQTLDVHDEIASGLVDRHGGRMVKSTGDGLLATFDGPARAIRCALQLRDEARSLGIEIRSGVHTGEVEIRGHDVGGIAVHIAARVAGSAQANEVLVSRTVVDLVAGSGMVFADRGSHALKGVPEEWRLFAAGP